MGDSLSICIPPHSVFVRSRPEYYIEFGTLAEQKKAVINCNKLSVIKIIRVWSSKAQRKAERTGCVHLGKAVLLLTNFQYLWKTTQKRWSQALYNSAWWEDKKEWSEIRREDSDQTLRELFFTRRTHEHLSRFPVAILSSETLKPNWTKLWAALAEFRIIWFLASEWILEQKAQLFYGLIVTVLSLPDCKKDFNIGTSDVNTWELEICFFSKLILSSLIALEYYSFNRVFSMPLYQSLCQSSQCHSHTFYSSDCEHRVQHHVPTAAQYTEIWLGFSSYSPVKACLWK